MKTGPSSPREDAEYYLLARMHRQNLDLQTAPLGNLDQA
jgi:hypothetical protein